VDDSEVRVRQEILVRSGYGEVGEPVVVEVPGGERVAELVFLLRVFRDSRSVLREELVSRAGAESPRSAVDDIDAPCVADRADVLERDADGEVGSPVPVEVARDGAGDRRARREDEESCSDGEKASQGPGNLAPGHYCFNSGAAQESNLPSDGLRRLTGFEDRLGHRARAAPRLA
jgi:hypothetical protein